MYALATNLIGFSKSTLRVRVLRTHSDGSVSVVTADLADAGTTLLLGSSQLQSIGEPVPSVCQCCSSYLWNALLEEPCPTCGTEQ